MLTARSVILATVLIAVISLAALLFSTFKPPGTEGLGADSFGTRAHGHRALFEMLDELGIPVQRVLMPPTEILDQRIVLVLWKPHLKMIAVEPLYLQKISKWVRRGGKVIVAPGGSGGNPDLVDGRGRIQQLKPKQVLEKLGLENVAVQKVSLKEAVVQDEAVEVTEEKESVFGKLVERHVPVAAVRVRVEGTWEAVEATVSSLAVPAEGAQVLDLENPDFQLPDALETAFRGTSVGRLLVSASNGKEHTLALRHRLGRGELIVVGDPKVFENRFLAREDNAVLAYHLMAAPDRLVAFDEFYHGLTIRGNPFYLLSRPPYGFVLVILSLVVGIWVWRQSLVLGPPLAMRIKSRRTIEEYVDAMAHLFWRARSTERFLLKEFRDGVLWTLRTDLNLPPGHELPEQIATALARREPDDAQELLEALRMLDETLSSNERLSRRQLLKVLQRVSACL